MYAVVGILILTAGAAVSAWIHAQFQRPTPPSWTGQALTVLAAKLAELTLLTSGLALFGRHMLRVGEQPFGHADAILIAAFATAFVVSVALFRISWRTRRRRRRTVETRDLLRPVKRREVSARFGTPHLSDAKPRRTRVAGGGKRSPRCDAA